MASSIAPHVLRQKKPPDKSLGEQLKNAVFQPCKDMVKVQDAVFHKDISTDEVFSRSMNSSMESLDISHGRDNGASTSLINVLKVHDKNVGASQLNLPEKNAMDVNASSRNKNVGESYHNLSQEHDMHVSENNDSAVPPGFELPNSRKRARINAAGADALQFPSINHRSKLVDNVAREQNRYAILGDIDIETEHVNSVRHDLRKDSAVRNAERGVASERRSFCPPIFLFNVKDLKTLIDQLKARNVVFRIVNKSKYKSKLYLQDPVAHSEMMTLLRNKKIESYSFTPKEMRKKSIVVRGLHHNMDVEAVKAEINDIVPESVESVSKFQTAFSRKNNFDTSLYLVTLCTGRGANEVRNIKEIDYQMVTWERPDKKRREVQCWRCQKWGHMSANCNRLQVCMKCGEGHPARECAMEEGSAPFCANCKTQGHTSNWRGCSAYKEYVEIRELTRDSDRKLKEQASANVVLATRSSFVRPEGLYSDVLRSPPAVPAVSEKPPLIHAFLKIAKELCGQENIESKVERFVRNYARLPREQAKRECLSLLKEVVQNYGP